MTSHDPTWSDPHERALAERGAALIAAAVAETRAPQALRERIEAERSRAVARPSWWARRGPVLGGLSAAVTVAVVALIVIAGGGGASGPSVLAVADLAARGPAQPAPAEASRTVLARSVDGVRFPNWQYSFRWNARGARADRIHGRRATTVFYDGPTGRRLAYTIVAGKALSRVHGASTTVRSGTTLWTLRRGGRTIVTWERAGHTCVISATSAVPATRLQALAAWRDGGSLRF
jgi:hypothetical protein